MELTDDEARLVDMLRKEKMFRAEPVPTEVRTCDIITRLECPTILKQHDPHAVGNRSWAVLETLQDTRDRRQLKDAFDVGRFGRVWSRHRLQGPSR